MIDRHCAHSAFFYAISKKFTSPVVSTDDCDVIYRINDCLRCNKVNRPSISSFLDKQYVCFLMCRNTCKQGLCLLTLVFTVVKKREEPETVLVFIRVFYVLPRVCFHLPCFISFNAFFLQLSSATDFSVSRPIRTGNGPVSHTMLRLLVRLLQALFEVLKIAFVGELHVEMAQDPALRKDSAVHQHLVTGFLFIK